MGYSKDKKTGLYYRRGTYDLEVIRSMNGEYFKYLDIEPNDIVLDIGGNIGAFAAEALKYTDQVKSIEPDPDNFKLLKKNAGECFHSRAAVVSDDRSNITLYLNAGINKGAHSLVVTRGRASIQVPCVRLVDLIEDWPPDILKVDIEGYEYELLFDKEVYHDGLKQLAVEFHLNRKEWRNEKAPKLLKLIKRMGFKPVKKPTIGEKNWHSVGIFRRS